MGKPKQVKTVSNWKRKTWYTVNSPKLFGTRPIGETPAIEASEVQGRTMKVNMMTLTGNVRKQSVSAKLEINKVSGKEAFTMLKGYELLPSFVKRMIRKGRNRLDESIPCECKDGAKMRMKILILTRGMTTGGQQKELRVLIHKFVQEQAKALGSQEIMGNIMTNSYQKALKEKLSKIYPLKSCEVRKVDILKYGREDYVPAHQKRTEVKPVEKPMTPAEKYTTPEVKKVPKESPAPIVKETVEA